jgi:UDP-glucose 4-epimerase
VSAPLHVLVTGASGFVGRHVCTALKASGVRLSCLSRNLPEAAAGHYALDLLDAATVRQLLADLRPDCVIHLAASRDSGAEPSAFRATFDTNVRSAWNVIEGCQALPHFKRFVFLGSFDEYGRAEPPYVETQLAQPTSAYGLSKLAITQALLGLHTNYAFPAVVLRPTVIYGPGQGDNMFLPSLIRTLLAGQTYAMTRGEQTRDFLYVGDVVTAVLKAVQADARIDGNVINLGAGHSHSIKCVVDMVLREMPSAITPQVQFGAIPYRRHEAMRYAANIERAAALLAWQPTTDMQRGLRATIDYYVQADHGID